MTVLEYVVDLGMSICPDSCVVSVFSATSHVVEVLKEKRSLCGGQGATASQCRRVGIGTTRRHRGDAKRTCRSMRVANHEDGPGQSSGSKEPTRLLLSRWEVA